MKKISEKTLFEGQWLSLKESIYENKDGLRHAWESVVRTKSTVGVIVVARLIPSQRFILIKQFRPAIPGYVLGFPAGLTDGNPEHALVELKEETGYVGIIKEVSPVLKTGSSIINDSGRIVCIEVNELDPRNQNPQQELEPTEDIEVYLVKKEEAKRFLLKQHSAGVQVSSNLWYLFGM